MKLNASIPSLLLFAGGVVAKGTGVRSCGSDSTSKPSDYPTLQRREVGARNTADWRVWLLRGGEPISFWHDVPLYPDEEDHQVVNMVVEIPRWTNGKIEISRTETLNPIFHDVDDDLPRFVEDVWPHKSYPFIYGSVPQTWESPNFDHEFTEYPGDNDPVDIIDIGDDFGYVGQVKQVKVLGALALADGEETDWKILAIDVNDPLAPLVSSVEDVEMYKPGLTDAYREWFMYYKIARGDGLIPIVGNTYKNATFTVSVLEESHGYWEQLVEGSVDGNEINYNQTLQNSLHSFVSRCDTRERFDIPRDDRKEPAVGIPDKYTKWYFLNKERHLIVLPKNQ